MSVSLSRKAASEHQVGDVVQSILTESEFQSLRGNTWVLMDGRNITGSALAALTGIGTLPDARGQFLRGKNNGRSDGNEDPDGERSLGSFQDDAMQGHFHDFYGAFIPYSGGGGSNLYAPQIPAGIQNLTGKGVGSSSTDGVSGTPKTAVETRVKNCAINIFIKINE